MMKVLFVTNFPSAYRVDFFNELGKGCDLTVAYERKKAAHRDEKWQGAKGDHFREIYMRLRPKGTSQSRGSATKNTVKCGNYDVVIFGGYASPSVIRAIVYCRTHKQKYYIEFDGSFDKTDPFLKRIVKKYLLKGAEGCFVTSEETARYIQKMGISTEKIIKYPFTSVREEEIIASPLSFHEKAELRKRLNLPEGQLIISVGQFIYRKGYDLLLEALSNVEHSVSVIIVGGEATDEYIELCERYNLTNVRFLPFLRKRELFQIYKAADLFVLPTREDVWGLVINEAMSCGLPIISTYNCIAATELIDNGRNGMLVPSNDSNALAVAIKEILSRDLYKMGEASLACIRNFSIEKMAQKHIEALYERVNGRS